MCNTIIDKRFISKVLVSLLIYMQAKQMRPGGGGGGKEEAGEKERRMNELRYDDARKSKGKSKAWLSLLKTSTPI